MAQGIIYRFNTNKIAKVINNARISGNNVFGDNGSVRIGEAGRCILVADNTVQIIEDEKGNEIYKPDIYNEKWIQVEAKKTIEERLSNIENETVSVKTRIEKLEQKEAMK